jgi:hypothetical protein
LIEVAVVTNAAVSAHTIQREICDADGVQAAYGVYVLADRMVWAPRVGSKKVVGPSNSADHGAGLRRLRRFRHGV